MKPRTVQLGEVCGLVMGQSPPGSSYNANGDGLPFFQGKADFGEMHPTVRVFCNQPSRVAEAGDILMSVRAPVGPTNMARERCCIGRGLAALRPGGRLDSKFLLYFLRYDERRLAAQGQGSTFDAINRDDLEDMEIPLPPVSEQRRIAERLEQANRLRRTRRYALELTEAFLPAAFRKLFGEALDGAPVSVSERARTLPPGWRYEKLVDVARLATGHTPDRRKPEYWNGDVPWITLTDIRALDGHVASVTAEYATSLGIENSSAVRLPTGTVCFSRTASVGFVTMMGREMSTSQDFVNWVCGPAVAPIFLMHALIASRRELRSLANGSTHQTIYFPTVEQFRLIVPPLVLQQRFVVLVERVERLRAVQRESLRQAEHLFASLLSQAFSG